MTEIFMRKFSHSIHGLVSVALVAALAAGCAKRKSDEAPPVAPPPADGGPTDRGEGFDPSGVGGGANSNIVTFKPTNLSVFSDYVKIHPINTPEKFQLKVDLDDIGGGRYAGRIEISYYDYGKWWTGSFESGSGVNQVSYKNRYVGLSEAEFNRWFTWQGKRVFHGFFQDSIGAVILVIDDGIDLGDGGGLINVSGSVYYKNFALPGTYDPPASGEKCWFLMIGPYNCATFKGADGFVNTFSALYPAASDGYQKLGTFQGLNRLKAFNE